MLPSKAATFAPRQSTRPVEESSVREHIASQNVTRLFHWVLPFRRRHDAVQLLSSSRRSWALIPIDSCNRSAKQKTLKFWLSVCAHVPFRDKNQNLRVLDFHHCAHSYGRNDRTGSDLLQVPGHCIYRPDQPRLPLFYATPGWARCCRFLSAVVLSAFPATPEKKTPASHTGVKAARLKAARENSRVSHAS